ncbi:MAG: hypothetical protein V4739_04760 [Pseudomonadota bacterium]
MAVQLITQAEYAARRQCSRAAVTKAVKEGRVTLTDGKLDPVAADAQWRANTRARAGLGSGGEPEVPEGEERGAEESYLASRGRREAAEASLAELKLGVEAGRLLRADDVRTALARKAAGLRESLMQIPSRLAPVLAAKDDAGEVHKLLELELRQVLEQLTGGADV